MPDSNADVSFNVTVLVNTGKSLRVENEDGEETFFPISEIKKNSPINEDSEKGDEGVLIVPFWLAKDRGWAFDT